MVYNYKRYEDNTLLDTDCAAFTFSTIPRSSLLAQVTEILQGSFISHIFKKKKKKIPLQGTILSLLSVKFNTEPHYHS